MTRRTIFGVIAGSLVTLFAGGAALVGGRAWAHGPGGLHGGIMKRMISSALDEALAKANVSAEQRTAIHASRDRAFAAFEQNMPDRRAHKEQFLAAFEKDQLDLVQLQAMHAQMEQRRQTIRDAVGQALVEIHDTLTPEQRRIVADYARQFGPGGMR
ncbi:MAG TPA: periplasmic heavy metal sensor [Methylomirabilota bacterium]|jgi:Spy/CpxP family protein refolding chaperone|nr:periplasmic heavy metal sensor [Methylomirabilota bacterium]